MAAVARQVLARYAFFEQARGASASSEDALLPLVLPAIAGRGYTIFSAQTLSEDLAPLFGDDLVVSLAESMVEPLSRNGYIKREIRGEDGSVYVYTEKANAIPTSSSIPDAEKSLSQIMSALRDYIVVSSPIKPLRESDDALQEAFVDWITTSERSDLDRNAMPSGASGHPDKADQTVGISQQLRLLFSSFIAWLARERSSIFDLVMPLVELGLIIDLVSELRFPSKPLKRVSLIAVLDSRLVMELLGLYGVPSQHAILRLMTMCKEYGVTVITLNHLVDEIKEITYNVLQSPQSAFPGSVNEAIRLHPEVHGIVKRVYASPDQHIRKAGVNIVPYMHLHNAAAEQYFNARHIRDFADALPYDKAKPTMAKRDSWSLAYAVRRQNGTHTSNLYDCKCVVLTRSPGFVSSARRYLMSDAVGYPSYAVTPVIELRHFSTLFMLSFGSDLTRKVLRSELVASCDRVIRVSPDLTRRIRSVLSKVEGLPPAQLDAALADPTTLAEFAVATGNDPSVVTSEKSASLLEIIRTAAQKDQELRHLEDERLLREKYGEELQRERQVLSDKDALIEGLKGEVRHHNEEALQASALLSDVSDVTVALMVDRVGYEVRLYWFGVLGLALAVSVGLMLDTILHFTSTDSWVKIVVSLLLGLGVFYSGFIPFAPKLGPDHLRNVLTRWVARRQLARFAQADLHDQVLARLGLEKDPAAPP